MATAISNKELVTTGVTLNLSVAEAEALRTLLHHVGGGNTGANLVRRVDRALRHAGVDCPEHDYQDFRGHTGPVAGGSLMWEANQYDGLADWERELLRGE